MTNADMLAKIDELGRTIDTVLAERDGYARRLDSLTLPSAERRERIATACLAGMLADRRNHAQVSRERARGAVSFADALIAALDAPVKP